MTQKDKDKVAAVCRCFRKAAFEDLRSQGHFGGEELLKLSYDVGLVLFPEGHFRCFILKSTVTKYHDLRCVWGGGMFGCSRVGSTSGRGILCALYLSRLVSSGLPCVCGCLGEVVGGVGGLGKGDFGSSRCPG